MLPTRFIPPFAPFRIVPLVLVIGLIVAGGCSDLQRPAPQKLGKAATTGNATWGSSEAAGQKDRGNEQKLARRIHELVNEARRQHGKEALTWDRALGPVAQAHSSDMSRTGHFSHVNRRGQDPTKRAEASGFACEKEVGDRLYQGVAENLYMTGLYSRWASVRNASGTVSKKYYWKSGEELAVEVVRGWLDSPGHRTNLLNGLHDSEAIGVAITDDFKVYVTQNLC